VPASPWNIRRIYEYEYAAINIMNKSCCAYNSSVQKGNEKRCKRINTGMRDPDENVDNNEGEEEDGREHKEERGIRRVKRKEKRKEDGNDRVDRS